MSRHVQAEIITIGDEILIGQIVDTNSAWMAVELNKSGFELIQITSVHDDEQKIIEALDRAFTHADVVLITGGIGPTKDDITKQSLCKYFDTRLVFNEATLQNILELFAERNIQINELTKAQAMVPEKALIIQNKQGTAPVTWFEKDGKVAVSMPGVPYEMKYVMSGEIIPRLQSHFKTPAVLHKTVQVYGYPESVLALKIAAWENALPDFLHLAYLPNYGIIRLRLSGVANDALMLDFALNQQLSSLKEILGNAIIACEDIPLEQLTGNILTAQSKTLATAESCTGGNIAHRLTLFPGASAYFKGSVVAYDNAVKTSLLRVEKSVLETQGAVSKEVVEQMADGVRHLLRTDLAVAVSGIAGPSGGTKEKPAGSVWIAACSKDTMISREFHFGTFREQNIQRATQAALVMLKEVLETTP
ncbi:MAG: CinA family nicotinamide mononucleotide deamidase-related protein [Prevotellaceae bacterium]|jgi:nicotinamide-nucleotide amidase|nr:CinA family nicotinamide mononucleotide deamidase-related protein [Prevotellaceae bacterium]